MTAAALLQELTATGIHLQCEEGNVRVRAEPGISLAPYLDRIKANKPALLAELRIREEVAAMGLGPNLRWLRVSTAPVEASRPPEGWQGQVPAGCRVPLACCVLGPCPHFTQHARCWTERTR